MKDAGYQYINIDDCWSVEGAARAADGSLQPDAVAVSRRHHRRRRLRARAGAEARHLRRPRHRDVRPPRRLRRLRDERRDDVRVVGRRLRQVGQLRRQARGDPAAVPVDARRDGRLGAADGVQRLRVVVLRMGDPRRPPAADDDRHPRHVAPRHRIDRHRIDHDQPEDQPRAGRVRRPEPLERSRHAGGRQQRQRHRARSPPPNTRATSACGRSPPRRSSPATTCAT